MPAEVKYKQNPGIFGGEISSQDANIEKQLNLRMSAIPLIQKKNLPFNTNPILMQWIQIMIFALIMWFLD